METKITSTFFTSHRSSGKGNCKKQWAVSCCTTKEQFERKIDDSSWKEACGENSSWSSWYIKFMVPRREWLHRAPKHTEKNGIRAQFMQGHACLPGGGRGKLTSIKDANFAKKNIDSDFNINFTLHAITCHFEVYCTNDGCQWKGNFGCSEEHSNRCAKLKLQCENNGCHQFLRREEMVSHLL